MYNTPYIVYGVFACYTDLVRRIQTPQRGLFMKIKAIRLYKKTGAPAIVEVEAENGLKGYSELACPIAQFTLGLVKNRLIGRSVYNTESMGEMFRCHDNGPLSSALGAVEACMWDIFGKKTRQPVYNLLGGKMLRPIVLRACGWDTDCVTPQEYAEAAVKVVAKGYTSIKFNPLHGLPFATLDFRRLVMTPAADVIRAVRKAVGPDIKITLDLDHILDHDQTMSLFKDIEDMEIACVSNPCLYGDFGGIYKLAQTFDQPMEDGEYAASVLELEQFIEKGDVATVTFDTDTIGGICETRIVTTLTEAHYLKVSYTYESFGGFLANIHSAAVAANLSQLDISLADLERASGTWRLAHEIKDGKLILNDGAAGLGAEPDLEGYEEVQA